MFIKPVVYFTPCLLILRLFTRQSTWWQRRDKFKQMATSESGRFRIPPPLEVNSGNVPENYRRWKRQMEVYLAASGASAKEGKVQTAIILNCAGPQVLEVYDK